MDTKRSAEAVNDCKQEQNKRVGAEGGIRTPTLLRASAPQAGASASSATSAQGLADSDYFTRRLEDAVGKVVSVQGAAPGDHGRRPRRYVLPRSSRTTRLFRIMEAQQSSRSFSAMAIFLVDIAS